MTATVLTINGGSSSIKFAVFAPGAPPRRLLAGQVERIGLGGAVLRAKNGDSGSHTDQPVDAPDHGRAAEQLIRWLRERDALGAVAAVGHRVVHGGPRYTAAQPVTAEVVAELKRLRPLDPDHLPGEIALIEAIGRCLPGVPQVACFDTAFHHDLPRVARLLPVPRHYEAAGVRRYGFHGLSYAYLLGELARAAGPEAARGRVVLAHLGAGASLAAVHQGKCVDTTMGFTPTAGLMMGTRSGDLDPGLLVYLMRHERLSFDQLDELVNRRSGLLGVSETSPDMRDLLARQGDDPRAADAVAMFCYQAKKWVGAMAAALGGLDTLVFAGGIGENAAEVRARVCEGLDFLGVRLDPGRNATNAAVVSADGARCAVRVMKTDEELKIVGEVLRIWGDRSGRP
jgi:acetate kinase